MLQQEKTFFVTQRAKFHGLFFRLSVTCFYAELSVIYLSTLFIQIQSHCLSICTFVVLYIIYMSSTPFLIGILDGCTDMYSEASLDGLTIYGYKIDSDAVLIILLFEVGLALGTQGLVFMALGILKLLRSKKKIREQYR